MSKDKIKLVWDPETVKARECGKKNYLGNGLHNPFP